MRTVSGRPRPSPLSSRLPQRVISRLLPGASGSSTIRTAPAKITERPCPSSGASRSSSAFSPPLSSPPSVRGLAAGRSSSSPAARFSWRRVLGRSTRAECARAASPRIGARAGHDRRCRTEIRDLGLLHGDHPLDLGAAALPFTFLAVLGFFNAVNFLEGLDGLAAGVGLVVWLGLLVLTLAGGLWPFAALALVWVAALLACLPGNLGVVPRFLPKVVPRRFGESSPRIGSLVFRPRPSPPFRGCPRFASGDELRLDSGLPRRRCPRRDRSPSPPRGESPEGRPHAPPPSSSRSGSAPPACGALARGPHRRLRHARRGGLIRSRAQR